MKSTDKTKANTVVVLDFETSGLSPAMGDRAIEIGAVLIEDGIVTQRFQELMNPGFRIDSFIASYTGITNKMLAKAPPCNEVMDRFADFIADHNLVAHNASFDQRFLEAEFSEIKRKYQGDFACSMLIARRLYQKAPNHKLSGLVEYKNIPTDGVFHRALADSEMTAKLWLRMLTDIDEDYALPAISFHLMQQIARKPKATVNGFLTRKSNVST